MKASVLPKKKKMAHLQPQGACRQDELIGRKTPVVK
jgi:hypothetical protein